MPGPTPLQDQTDPLVGRVLSARYRVLRKLGEGGIGRIYLADHVGVGREVVLKVLLPEYAGSPELAERLLEEARTVSRLGHENIIDIYYGGRSPEGLVFLAMEHLRGQDLAALLRSTGPMHWERARPILLQIAGALATVHAHGFIHGDIKPENVFLISEARQGSQVVPRRDFVKLLDFGIARMIGLGGGGEGRFTLVGTPQYVAPEQTLAREVDGRADVYSLGCVMYQMATGTVPFTADSAIELMARHHTEAPIPPRQRRPDLEIPPAVESVILRAMEKDPASRFATMDEMSEAIARCRPTMPALPAQAEPPSGSFRMDDRRVVHRARLRRRLQGAALGALAVASLAASIVAFRPGPPGRLRVEIEPADATVLVDGHAPAARTMLLGPGRHLVVGSRPGYVPRSQEVVIPSQGDVALALTLRVSPLTGIDVTSDPPGAEIWIDGAPVPGPGIERQALTPSKLQVAPGWHVIEIRSPIGTGSWRRQLEVLPDQMVRLHAVLARPPAKKLISRGRKTLASLD